MVDDISGEEIDAPSESFLDLGMLLPIILCLPRTHFPFVLSNLPIPAPPLLLLVGMVALDLVLAVGTHRLPPVQQRIRAKFHPLGHGVHETDTIPLAVNWYFLGSESFVDDGYALRGCGLIFINLLIFSKGRGHDGPLLRIGLILCLILDQTGKIGLLDFVEPAKDVPLHQDIDDPFIEDGDVLEGLKRTSTEDLIPGNQFSEVTFEVERTGVEIGLAVGAQLVNASYTCSANILHLTRL